MFPVKSKCMIVDGANTKVISKFNKELLRDPMTVANMVGYRVTKKQLAFKNSQYFVQLSPSFGAVNPSKDSPINNATFLNLNKNVNNSLSALSSPSNASPNAPLNVPSNKPSNAPLNVPSNNDDFPPLVEEIKDDDDDDDDDMKMDKDDDHDSLCDAFVTENEKIIQCLRKDDIFKNIMDLQYEWCWAHKCSLIIKYAMKVEVIQQVYETMKKVGELLNNCPLVHKLFKAEQEIYYLIKNVCGTGNVPNPQEIRWQYVLDLAEKLIHHCKLITLLIKDIVNGKYLVSDESTQRALNLEQYMCPIYWLKIAYS